MLLVFGQLQSSASAATQLRVSVNWWKRTALPFANFQTCAKGTSSGLPVALALAV